MPSSVEAFTITANGLLNRIITDIAVCAAFDPKNPPSPVPPLVGAKALWDTGATHSVISTQLAKQLGLISVGVADVSHGGGEGTSPRYAVNFKLPHNVGVLGVLVTEFPEPKDKSFNVIVGMDVICLGDFAVTNVSGKTCMSFRTPSCEVVDYVHAVNKLKYAGIGRNDPCPCNSGQKFKKCHGR